MPNNVTLLKDFLERQRIYHFWYYQIQEYNPLDELFGACIEGTADDLLNEYGNKLDGYEVVDVQCDDANLTRTVIVEAIDE